MIDWTQVDILRTEIGQAAFEEVVELFLTEMHAEMDALMQEKDPDKLEARFHVLKGSALNLGFAKFSELCGAAEADAAKGAPDFGAIPNLSTTYEASRAAFLSGIADRVAG